MRLITSLRVWRQRWRFTANNAKLRAQGYRYAVTKSNGAVCLRVHLIGCHNLLPKRAPIKAVYFKNIEDVTAARGITTEDKDWIYCQSCRRRIRRDL